MKNSQTSRFNQTAPSHRQTIYTRTHTHTHAHVHAVCIIQLDKESISISLFERNCERESVLGGGRNCCPRL